MTDSESGYEEQNAVAEEPAQAGHVGAFLCATRMRSGGDLQEIAKILRIRYGYLVAIEDGRYEDLPGSAYSIGFVRAYADYLGLDGNEVVRRLREESTGKVKSTRFEFHAPSGDSGLPNGGLLAVAIGLGMVVYAAWYTMSNVDRDAVDLIQEVPGRLAMLIDEESQTSGAAPPIEIAQTAPNPVSESALTNTEPEQSSTEESSQEDVVVAVNTSDQDARMAEEETGAVVSKESSTDQENTQTATVDEREAEIAAVETPAADEPDITLPSAPGGDTVREEESSTESAPVSSEPVEQEVEETPVQVAVVPQEDSLEDSTPLPASTEPTDTSETPASEQEETAEEEVASAPEEAITTTEVVTSDSEGAPSRSDVADTERAEEPAPALEESEEAPQQQTASASDSGESFADGERLVIELRAKSDSWIQVRDGDDLLLTRLLRQGEVYRVPDRDGLTLMTGNAGGLEVFVGEELMPPLGDEGVVRRGVPLSAERLRSGVAPG